MPGNVEQADLGPASPDPGRPDPFGYNRNGGCSSVWPLCLPGNRLQALPRIHAQSLAPSLAIRLLRLTGTVILAAVAVFCVVLLTIRFVVFPNIDDYRGPIAAKLSRQLGQPVTIDSLAGGWDGWNPKFAITGFAIRDRALPTGAPVLLLPRVDLLVAWTSLLVFDLRLKELSIERPELSIRRDTLGRLHIAGFEIDPETQDDDAPFMNWLLRQRQIVVRNALVSWNDELRGSPVLVLDNVMFRLERGLIASLEITS